MSFNCGPLGAVACGSLTLAIALTAYAMVGGIPGGASDAGVKAALARLEEEVQRDFPAVDHVAPTDIASDSDGRDVVLVDVREVSEYAVSRLPGAVRVDPDADPKDLITALGNVAGKRIVLYCSVGVRSSKLAERARKVLRAAGAEAVANLSGGIFRWHNEGRQLVDANSRADAIHPYNPIWARYVSSDRKISYLPE